MVEEGEIRPDKEQSAVLGIAIMCIYKKTNHWWYQDNHDRKLLNTKLTELQVCIHSF